MSATNPAGAAPGLPSLVSRSSQNGSHQGDNAERQLAWAREMERAQMNSWFKPVNTARSGSGSGGTAHGQQRTEDAVATARAPQLGKMRQATSIAKSGPPKGPVPERAISDRGQGAEQFLADQSAEAGVAGVPNGVRATTGVVTGTVLSALQATNSISSQVLLTAGMQALMPSASAAVTLVSTPVGLRSSDDAASTAASEQTRGDEAQGQMDSVGAGTEPGAGAGRAVSGTEAPVRLHEESTPRGQAVWIAMRADDATLAAMLPQWVADLQRGMRIRGERLHQVVCNGQVVWRDDVATSSHIASAAGGDANSNMFDSIDSKEA